MSNIPLWRNAPPQIPGQTSMLDNRIFPSGRQALTAAIVHAQLGRSSRVAIPEWSSHCVISAVGKFATPLPSIEVFAHNLRIDCIVAYEQWGWPLSDEGIVDLSRLRDVVIILDRVDSANVFCATPAPLHDVYEVFSLSKVLGTHGGGLLRRNNDYLESRESTSGPSFSDLPGTTALPDSDFWNNFYKSEIPHRHPELKSWLLNNDLKKAFASEASARRENIMALLNSPLSTSLPRWMLKAVEAGCAPGIFPLYAGQPHRFLDAVSAELKTKLGVLTQKYHFDMAGNPCGSNYLQVLAFPIHGLMTPLLSACVQVIEPIQRLHGLMKNVRVDSPA